MAQEKTKEEKNFDWLERTIEGLLNDFEGGITEKEETMNQFFELIFDKLVAEIQELRDKLSGQLEPLVMQKIAEVDKIKEEWYYLNNKLQTRERIICRDISQEDAELILTILKMRI